MRIGELVKSKFDICDEPPLVSLIVPVYNVADVLPLSLNSIISQTYLNLEIILVDDGSTDMSLSICKAYAQNDRRVRVIQKTNGGLSSARNTGVDQARGQWLAYIDSDDLIDPSYVMELLGAALSNDCDTAVCSNLFIDCSCKVFPKCSLPINRLKKMKIVDGPHALAEVFSEKYSYCSACGKISKTSLWKKVVFPEGRLFEDFSRVDRLFLSSSRVALFDCALYGYRKGGETITAARSCKAALDLQRSIQELLNAIASYPKEVKRAAEFKVCIECARLGEMLALGVLRQTPNDKICIELMRFSTYTIKKYLLSGVLNPYAAFSQRTRIGLYALNPKLSIQLKQFVIRYVRTLSK